MTRHEWRQRKPWMLLRLLLVVPVLVGCGDAAPPPVVATLGGLTVSVAARPARIVVTANDGTVLLDGLPGGRVEEDEPPHVAAALRHAEASYEFAFGAFRIEETTTERWHGITELVDVTAVGQELRFGLRAGSDAVGEGVIREEGDGEVSITLTASPTMPGSAPATRASMAFRCHENEHFLGFGGQSFEVDHRGQTVPIWVQEDGITKVPVDHCSEGLWQIHGRRHSTHTPLPIYLSNRGYALLLETPYRSVFAVCSEASDVVRVEAWEGALRLRLFAGPSPEEVLRRLTGYLGRPALPPAFAFAPWLDALYGSDNVRRIAATVRSEGIPVSVLWAEDWRGGEVDSIGYTLHEDWHVDRDLYPDFEVLADDLHAQGFKLLVYNNTFLTAGADIFDEALALGHSIKDAAGEPYLFTGVKFVDSTLVDLSSPEAVTWTQEQYRQGLLLGADGYMADYAEWLPTDAVLASGESAVARHNLYPVDFQRLNRELFDELFAVDGVERLFFVRSAYLGSQPLVSVVWAGDQQTDFSEGDGLPSVIPMGIGLGIVGFPYFGHDIGGYMSQFTEPATRELWYRWTTLGALSPVMRTHHGKSAFENWNWESDAESTAHFRRWAALHLRLFPYLYAMAQEAAETGMPMMRPLALGYPSFEPGWTATDQFLLGDRLLVAPVVNAGATSREVDLPAGVFYPLLGGTAVTGGESVTVSAPLEEIPVLVPAGTLLVLLPEAVDTVVAADPSTGTVTLNDVGDDRELWLWPGGESSLTEVSGLSYHWTAGDLAPPYTSITWNGEPVPSVGVGEAFEITGVGSLTVNETATLEVAGGAADRRLWIVLRE